MKTAAEWADDALHGYGSDSLEDYAQGPSPGEWRHLKARIEAHINAARAEVVEELAIHCETYGLDEAMAKWIREWWAAQQAEEKRQ